MKSLHKNSTILFAAMIAFFVMLPAGASCLAQCKSIKKEDAAETARYIADVIIAGRGIVAANQGLINNPQMGDKGFTPEKIASEIRSKFKEMTGKDVNELAPDTKAVVEQVINAAMMSVKMNQKKINEKGKGFKGYIPAVFGRETGQILKGRCNIFIKQTTFKFRNAYNQPDNFEKQILKKFKIPDYEKGKGYGEFVNNDYRYMQPIYIKKACLKCHGEPKGSIDPAGRQREGYKEGDLRGAISVKFPVN